MENKQVEFSELRLGNILRIDGALSVVEGIKKEGINYYLVPNQRFLHQPSQGFKGETLTEEWLVRFGFEKYKRGNDEIFCIDDFEIQIHGDKYVLSIHGGETAPNLTQYFAHHTKHVHQLQNLYFALTGEELTPQGFNSPKK